MNAPWKPGPLGNRDPFAAFICDETALDVLRPVVIEMGWQPEKCNKGGLRNAVQSLSISASPAILLVDLSESGDPLNDINALAEVCEPGTVVIAAGQVNDVRLYRDLLASGIHDYLLKPLSTAQLRDALPQAQAVFMAPKSTDGDTVKKHVSTAVVGTRGGVGASTMATSLAWLFSADHELPTPPRVPITAVDTCPPATLTSAVLGAANTTWACDSDSRSAVGEIGLSR